MFKKIQTVFFLISALFLCVPPAFAAAPDGSGPWADSVVSANQGLMKNGLAVPALRSDSSAALGVAENDTVDSHFFSLGFGGKIVLGFVNGISSGVFIVEATNPNYPGEKATVEVSADGSTWVNAGTVTQDGSVDVPEEVSCAQFVRITDISDPSIMPDDIADGYDVDGAQALGESCQGRPLPTPTPPVTPTPFPTPSASPEPTPSTTSDNSSNNNSNTPGFPDAGGAPCTSNGVNTIPTILSAKRVSPTSILVSWGPDAGLSSFVIHYGFQSNNLQFSTNVSGFSTTINDLPPNQSIWIQVAATDGCATGAFGRLVLVGGTPATNSPGFPNTGNPLIPGLPNTGFDPGTLNSFWSGEVHTLYSWICTLAQKVHSFSTEK